MTGKSPAVRPFASMPPRCDGMLTGTIVRAPLGESSKIYVRFWSVLCRKLCALRRCSEILPGPCHSGACAGSPLQTHRYPQLGTPFVSGGSARRSRVDLPLICFGLSSSAFGFRSQWLWTIRYASSEAPQARRGRRGFLRRSITLISAGWVPPRPVFVVELPLSFDVGLLHREGHLRGNEDYPTGLSRLSVPESSLSLALQTIVSCIRAPLNRPSSREGGRGEGGVVPSLTGGWVGVQEVGGCIFLTVRRAWEWRPHSASRFGKPKAARRRALARRWRRRAPDRRSFAHNEIRPPRSRILHLTTLSVEPPSS